MAKTRIISTKKKNPVAKKKGSLKKLGKQVSRKHSGYNMKSIVKGNNTYKRKGRKR